MTNFIYDKARESFLTAGTSWTADTIKAVLVDTGAYTPNAATHQFLTDIPAGARIAISAALTAKTATAGVADAADQAFPGVTGVSAEAVVLFKDTGTAGTSNLLFYIDSATGLPVTPNGGDINLVWDNGANKICKL